MPPSCRPAELRWGLSICGSKQDDDDTADEMAEEEEEEEEEELLLLLLLPVEVVLLLLRWRKQNFVVGVAHVGSDRALGTLEDSLSTLSHREHSPSPALSALS